MTIGSCTSCQSHSNYMRLSAEREIYNQYHQIAPGIPYKSEQAQGQGNFKSDPSKIIDIQA